jgi:hypothetical protein
MQKTTFAIDEAEDDPTASLSSLDGGDSPRVRWSFQKSAGFPLMVFYFLVKAAAQMQ